MAGRKEQPGEFSERTAMERGESSAGRQNPQRVAVTMKRASAERRRRRMRSRS
jgi:hypothetical protein